MEKGKKAVGFVDLGFLFELFCWDFFPVRIYSRIFLFNLTLSITSMYFCMSWIIICVFKSQ